MALHLWLRAEVKPQEQRVAVTPDRCAGLIAEGFTLTVETMADRCAPDAEYAAAGCTMVEAGSWRTAPADAIIFGLKELPEDTPLSHTHIYFGHAYKNQGGWQELLGRFVAGKGTLLDLEYLTNEKGQRVAAFGYMAGFAGAAVGLLAHCARASGGELGPIEPHPNEGSLIADIREKLAAIGTKPRVLILGALGRCGTGAVTFLEKAGLADDQIIKWDVAETKAGGPFPALLEHDLVINCIYLSIKIPPFLTAEMLENADRKLTVLVDVSCDTSNPNNPLPFCNVGTTFADPIHRLTPAAGPALDIVAIDHLPTLLPLESSQMFCADLMPTILNLRNLDSDPVWQRAKALFDEKSAAATA